MCSKITIQKVPSPPPLWHHKKPCRGHSKNKIISLRGRWVLEELLEVNDEKSNLLALMPKELALLIKEVGIEGRGHVYSVKGLVNLGEVRNDVGWIKGF